MLILIFVICSIALIISQNMVVKKDEGKIKSKVLRKIDFYAINVCMVVVMYIIILLFIFSFIPILFGINLESQLQNYQKQNEQVMQKMQETEIEIPIEDIVEVKNSSTLVIRTQISEDMIKLLNDYQEYQNNEKKIIEIQERIQERNTARWWWYFGH